MSELNNDDELGIWRMYLFALKSPLTREKYQKRMEKFFDFICLDGKIVEEKSECFILMAGKEGSQRVFNNLIEYMHFLLKRVHDKKITSGTLRNYLKSIKLFCEMNDLELGWKKISRGLPKDRNASDDRSPTLEEIKKLIEYPEYLVPGSLLTLFGICYSEYFSFSYRYNV